MADSYKKINKGMGINTVMITKTYADFSTAGLTNNIEIFSLPAGKKLRDMYARIKTVFSGGTISAYTISVGIVGTVTKYMLANDVKTSAIDMLTGTYKGLGLCIGGALYTATTNIESFTAATSIRAYATSTTANLNQATQGIIEFYIEY